MKYLVKKITRYVVFNSKIILVLFSEQNLAQEEFGLVFRTGNISNFPSPQIGKTSNFPSPQTGKFPLPPPLNDMKASGSSKDPLDFEGRNFSSLVFEDVSAIRRAAAWQYFHYNRPESLAQCQIPGCPKIISCKNGMTALTIHLRGKHGIDLKAPLNSSGMQFVGHRTQ